jgi:hypothetical protein
MRLITFILSSGIALTWIPACASAQKITYGEGTIKHCPQAEGNIDCNHVQPMPTANSVQPTANSSGPARSQRAYGSLWQPRRARQPR